MEDYQAAFLQRHMDTETLCHSDRKVAAMHFGGITIDRMFTKSDDFSFPAQKCKARMEN